MELQKISKEASASSENGEIQAQTSLLGFMAVEIDQFHQENEENEENSSSCCSDSLSNTDTESEKIRHTASHSDYES